MPARAGQIGGWQRWAPYAVVAWSLIYAALGVYRASGGGGFPFTPEAVAEDVIGPLAGRFGPGVAWLSVLLAGIPAAALGTAMLRGMRGKALRPLFITAGVLLTGVLLMLMIRFNLLGVPVFYALTRFAWALGIPLGMSEEYLHAGQESGMWTSGLFLAVFGLVGAFLTLGLVQRWGERFPHRMVGLA